MQDLIVDVTEQNAKAILIDASYERLVVVDFWAQWCGPCKSLMPLLEKLAQEYSGEFLLAKVNADLQQMLTAQFGVRSLPTVFLMKDGQPVDGFAGLKSEQEIRTLLDKHLPKPWDKKHELGKEHLAAGEVAVAIPLLKEAYDLSRQQADIACTLADAYVQAKRLLEAADILAKVKMVDQDAYFEQVKAHLELAQNASKAPEIDALENRHHENPADEQVAFQLAVQYSQHEYYRESLTLLFALLKSNLNAGEGEVRKVFNDVLAILGKGDPLAVEFQRKIYALLY